MPHLSGGWMISVLSDVDLNIFVNTQFVFLFGVKRMLNDEVSCIKKCFTFEENADKRLRRDDAIEFVLLGATDTVASDFTSDICDRQRKYYF